MIESVSVAVRFRPLPASELQDEEARLHDLKQGKEVWSIREGLVINTRTQAQFLFDHVFSETAGNEEVFERAAKSVVLKTVEGFHGTIFAYGQTSSGKTHTMKGSKEQPGVIPLALTELFRAIREESDRLFLVKISYLEVYNEMINDLLSSGNCNLELRETLDRETYVQHLTETVVLSEIEAMEFLNKGEVYRKVRETHMNEQSSRSHTLFKVRVESSPIENADIAPVRISFLNLVDLAGSEAVQKTKAEGMRQREGSNINKSLLALAKLMKRLSEGPREGYIHCRDSKLTRLLQTSLSGNSKILVICTVTESIRHIGETTNTLQFGSNAKRIRITAKPNEVISSECQLRRANEEIYLLRTHLEDANSLAQKKEEELQRLREANSEKDQQVRDVREQLDNAIEDKVRMQERILLASKHIVNSAGKTKFLYTPQSVEKGRMPTSPEVSIHTESLEKDRVIQMMEQDFADKTVIYEEKYQSLLVENESLHKQLGALTEPSHFEQRVIELEMMLEEQQREREEINDIAREYEKQLESLRRERMRNRAEIDRLQRALDDEKSSNDLVCEELEEKKKELESVRSSAFASSTDTLSCASLQAALQEKKMKEVIDDYKKQLSELEADFNKRTADQAATICTEKREINQIRTQYQQAKAEAISLREQLQTAEEKYRALESDIREKATQLAIQYSERKRKNTEEIHDLQLKLEAAEQLVRDREAVIGKKEEEIEELNRRLTYKRLPSDLLDERLKKELTSAERYQLNMQIMSGINKVKELEYYIVKLEAAQKKMKDELDLSRAQNQTNASRIRDLEKRISQLERENLDLENHLSTRKSPCDLMLRRVAPMITPTKTQSQDDEEEVDLGSELKNACTPQ